MKVSEEHIENVKKFVDYSTTHGFQRGKGGAKIKNLCVMQAINYFFNSSTSQNIEDYPKDTHDTIEAFLEKTLILLNDSSIWQEQSADSRRAVILNRLAVASLYSESLNISCKDIENWCKLVLDKLEKLALIYKVDEELVSKYKSNAFFNIVKDIRLFVFLIKNNSKENKAFFVEDIVYSALEPIVQELVTKNPDLDHLLSYTYPSYKPLLNVNQVKC